jgi:hypothetical protein
MATPGLYSSPSFLLGQQQQ